MTEEQYQIFEDCGAAEMPIGETCEIAEVAEAAFMADAEAVRRYRKGQLHTKLKVRQAVIRMAREGVPQMVKIYADIAKTALDIPGMPAAPIPLDIDDSLDDMPEDEAK